LFFSARFALSADVAFAKLRSTAVIFAGLLLKPPRRLISS
jgi:hypothetical protein